MKRVQKIMMVALMILIGFQNLSAQSVRKFYKKLQIEKLTHCGVLIYDAAHDDTVFKHQANQYFVPASTTKLFTFYSALQHLPDTLTAFKYQETKDTLYVWGVGNPTLLNPAFAEDKALERLKNTEKHIVLCLNRYTGKPYGKGWMWDDYEDSYQPELNEFPLYGNVVNIKVNQKEVQIQPKIHDFSYEWSEKLGRNYHQNHFKIPQNSSKTETITYLLSAENTAEILGAYLNKKVELNPKKKIDSTAQIQYSSITRNEMLKVMMQESDNFIAEQVHLMICDAKNLEMNTESSIQYVKENSLHFIKEPFEWVDGSGLSRYDLFKPNQMVKILNQLDSLNDSTTHIKEMMAIGGKTGTLKKLFTLNSNPYLFGKTGTLTGVACLAGYIETQSGKTLTFAVMTNNHVAKAKEIRAEMEKLINFVYENY